MAGVGTHFLGVGLAVGFWSPGRPDLGEVGRVRLEMTSSTTP
jgi:hypothetical protein